MIRKKVQCNTCGKETYNQTIDWAGFCSRQCELLWEEKEKEEEEK